MKIETKNRTEIFEEDSVGTMVSSKDAFEHFTRRKKEKRKRFARNKKARTRR